MDLEEALPPVARVERIRELVDELPPDLQLVVSLHFFGDMTMTEVAAQLERTEYKVKKALNHAYSILRERLLEDDTLGALLPEDHASVGSLLGSPPVDRAGRDA